METGCIMGQSYEYCIKGSRSRLLDYGIAYAGSQMAVMLDIVFNAEHALTYLSFELGDHGQYDLCAAPCDDDCETGK
jgi:hypothetical protein